MPRPARVLAIARRDLALIQGRRRRWRLAALGLALLLPAAAIPVRLPQPGDGTPTVAGEPPEALRPHVRVLPRATTRLEGSAPLVVTTPDLDPALRQRLDEALPGPTVRVRKDAEQLPPPRRSTLVALLAISLLTGPMAETIPGERARKTLEILLTAGISRAELVLGKWAAWTGAATLGTAAATVATIASGVQEPGPWILGLPLVAACASALGLYLGRDASDEVSGASRSMRVIPVAAVVLASLAFALWRDVPALGAAVPFGGALLLAAGMQSEVVATTLGTLLGCGLLLAITARDLDASGPSEPQAPLARRLAVVALLWWLPVAGTAAWGIAGNPGFASRLPVGVALGSAGAALGLYALVEHLREHGRWSRPSTRGWALAPAVGLALAATPALSGLLPVWGNGPQEALRQRLGAALAPGWAGVLPTLGVVLGTGFFFRGLLQRRGGPVVAALAWTAICSPLDPIRGLISGFALAFLARRSLGASLLAHLTWALAPVELSLPSPALAALAAALAVGGALWRPAHEDR